MTEIIGYRIQTQPSGNTVLTFSDRKGKNRTVILTPRTVTTLREALAYQPGESVAEKTKRIAEKFTAQTIGTHETL